MPDEFTGIFKVGDKRTGQVTYVQVSDTRVQFMPVPFAQYVERGIKPDYQSLPWQEDWIGRLRSQ